MDSHAMDSHALFAICTPMESAQAEKMHPMALAFVGDAVHTLYVRTLVTESHGGSHTGELHRLTTETIAAVAQSAASDRIAPLFNEIETNIFRRARNCRIQTSAKHAANAEYRRASGLEAVLGYLYLTGQTERLCTFLTKTTDKEAK